MIIGIGCWMMSAIAVPAIAQAPLFPQPFLVEHQIVQTDAQGSKTLIGPVTDHYGGSWVVSVQPDGKRTIVDFSQERLTVIDDRRGRYATIGFDRISELKRRHRLAEFGSETPLDEPHDREAPGSRPSITAIDDHPVVRFGRPLRLLRHDRRWSVAAEWTIDADVLATAVFGDRLLLVSDGFVLLYDIADPESPRLKTRLDGIAHRQVALGDVIVLFAPETSAPAVILEYPDPERLGNTPGFTQEITTIETTVIGAGR